jgi:hypothetical protein
LARARVAEEIRARPNPFDVNPTTFVAMGNGDLIFSAFTNRRGVFAANAGGAKYAPSAVNLQPPPESFFTDSTHSGLRSDDTEAVPIGYDRDGGVYIQSNVGGSTIVRFRTTCSRKHSPISDRTTPSGSDLLPGRRLRQP